MLYTLAALAVALEKIARADHSRRQHLSRPARL
jgi:hypothetical protein